MYKKLSLDGDLIPVGRDLPALEVGQHIVVVNGICVDVYTGTDAPASTPRSAERKKPFADWTKNEASILDALREAGGGGSNRDIGVRLGIPNGKAGHHERYLLSKTMRKLALQGALTKRIMNGAKPGSTGAIYYYELKKED